LTISVLLALVLHPLLAVSAKLRFPRILSIFLATVLIVAALFFLGAVVFSSVRSILTLYPRYEKRLTDIYLALAEFFELTYDDQLSFFQNIWAQIGIRSRIQLVTFSMSSTFISFLRNALLVVLFMVFLLFEAVFFRKKLERAFEGKMAGQIRKIGSDMMRQISRYLSIKFIISLVTGAVVAVALWLVGLEFAIVWGVLQFVLNFIPILGSIVLGVGASLFALMQFWPNPQPIILVAIIMLAANIIIGNILEPKIMGDNLGLSPIVILIALMLWGFLWGFAGMVLAVPMMVTIKIICENVPYLEPVSILLGSSKAAVKKNEGEPESAENPEKADSSTNPA
jgi:predicted PurR-regulated permease PerM